MLLSIKHNFLFLANPKCASSSVEDEWRRYSQLTIQATRLGKHLTYMQVKKHLKFAFVRAERPIGKFFRFGIVRDPVDKAVSWYNYKLRHVKQPPPKEKAVADFELSVTEQAAKFEDKEPLSFGQRGFFSDRDGSLGVDYLIPLPRLSTDLDILRKALGVKKTKKPHKVRKNVSPTILLKDDIPEFVQNILRKTYVADVELYDMALNGHFGSPESAVARKLEQVNDGPRDK